MIADWASILRWNTHFTVKGSFYEFSQVYSLCPNKDSKSALLVNAEGIAFLMHASFW